MKTLKVNYLDYCTSDYFQGSPNTVIAVPVYGTMTFAELAEEIQADSEYMELSPEEYRAIDDYCNELKESPDSIAVTALEHETIDAEGDDTAYLYFDIR